MPLLPDTFKNKVVIVTGSSAGIGAATAAYFASLGASVVITGRNFEGIDQTKKLCISNGCSEDKYLTKQGDICDTAFQDDLVKSVVEKFGKIDILVNNHGIVRDIILPEADINQASETYSTLMQINVESVYKLTHKILPYLIETKGCIVNVGSVTGKKPILRTLVYSMTKAALDMFTKSLAIQLAPKSVRVNSVNPAVVITNIRKRYISDDEFEVYKKNMLPKHPIGRLGESEDIAKAIGFLASDDASFITGTLFDIDGGYLLV